MDRKHKIAAGLLGAGVVFVGLTYWSWAKDSGAPEKSLQWNRKKWGSVVPHKTFPRDCELCHQPERWDSLKKDIKFNHKKETGVELEGRHAQASCLRCHNDRGPIKAYVARGCSGCHADPHQGAMGLNCRRCHNPRDLSWRASGLVNDHSRTRFPLSGTHLLLPCETCHTNAASGDYRGLSPDCYNCHSHQYTTAPSHVSDQFSHDCTRCHTTNSFSNPVMNHAGLANCYGCHASKYPEGPNHVARNFPHTCGDCHRTTSWSDHTMNHAGFTNCFTCHADDYNGAPLHVAGAFSQNCSNCHGTSTWADAHSRVGTNCYSCHSVQYNSMGPQHASRSFPRDCGTSCHTTTAWPRGPFTHRTIRNTQGASAPDEGENNHYNFNCNECHTSFLTTVRSCSGCH